MCSFSEFQLWSMSPIIPKKLFHTETKTQSLEENSNISLRDYMKYNSIIPHKYIKHIYVLTAVI